MTGMSNARWESTINAGDGQKWSNFIGSDLVNGGGKSTIFLDIFYRLFTDLNCKPFAGWGSRPEICQLTTKLLLGNSTAGLLQGFKPNRDICLG